MVGGADSVVTPAPPQAPSSRARPARAAGTTRAGRRSRLAHHELGAGTLVPSSQLMEARASAVVQSGACGFCRSCRPPSLRSAAQLRVERALLVRRRGVDEALAPGGVDEDVAVGVVDVVGQRLARVPVGLGRLLLGHDLVLDAERLPERGDVGRRAGPEVPVGAELLLVGGQAGHGVAARVDRGLDEDDAVRQPGGAQVALQRDEGAGDERALVLAQGEEGRQDDDLAAQRGQRDGLALLVDQRRRVWGVGRSRTRPWFGGGAAGADEPQAASSTPRARARARTVTGARRGAKRVRRRPPRGAGT